MDKRERERDSLSPSYIPSAYFTCPPTWNDTYVMGMTTSQCDNLTLLLFSSLLFSFLRHHRYYRHEMLQGPVNDENAYAMGGVAGHAGEET